MDTTPPFLASFILLQPAQHPTENPLLKQGSGDPFGAAEAAPRRAIFKTPHLLTLIERVRLQPIRANNKSIYSWRCFYMGEWGGRWSPLISHILWWWSVSGTIPGMPYLRTSGLGAGESFSLGGGKLLFAWVDSVWQDGLVVWPFRING